MADRETQGLFLADETATHALGAALANDLRRGGIVCLYGGLGAGKTALARAVISQLQRDAGCPPEDIPSPTYTILQTYQAGELSIRHFDFYRIEQPGDVYELGWEEALAEGLVLVEWPERLGPLLPSDRLEIHVSSPGGEGRDVHFKTYGIWHGGKLCIDA